MPRSMTAYGRAMSSEMDGCSWLVEIHSVNRKGLDIHMHLPREFLFLDLEMRKHIAKSIHRGLITVKMSFKKEKPNATTAILQKKKKAWETIAQELGYPKESVDLPFLLAQIDPIPFEEETKLQEELKKILQIALDQCIQMKKQEGKVLEEDIQKQIHSLEDFTEKVQQLSRDCVKTYREKLTSKLKDLIRDIETDERVLREIALFAEKVDIQEEIVRIKSHIQQIRKKLASEEKSMGKTLEFLTQEMLREINTIGAKSVDLEISRQVIHAKSELEKIREQVQNIE